MRCEGEQLDSRVRNKAVQLLDVTRSCGRAVGTRAQTSVTVLRALAQHVESAVVRCGQRYGIGMHQGLLRFRGSYAFVVGWLARTCSLKRFRTQPFPPRGPPQATDKPEFLTSMSIQDDAVIVINAEGTIMMVSQVRAPCALVLMCPCACVLTCCGQATWPCAQLAGKCLAVLGAKNILE